MKKIYLVLVAMCCYSAILAQDFKLSGKITDQYTNPISGVKVSLSGTNRYVFSDSLGRFSLFPVNAGAYQISASKTGFSKQTESVVVGNLRVYLIVKLTASPIQLHEVEIAENRAEKRAKSESMNVETINRDFLMKNLGGSLMQSIERIPGIKTIGIGSGQSKPLIRGMGFNRVVVVDKGIKHEGQQWGSDHGLEIDQYAAREVEVIKGAASFVYGSDAIAGIVEVKPPLPPQVNSINGSVDFIGKSNNALYGTSINLNGRTKRWFFDSRLTYQNYGDYQVPADSIYVYDYAVPLNNGYLRNTAGRETNLHFNAGYIAEHFRTVFYLSNVASKSGFFANAHGLEPRKVDTELHDAFSRDIQMPNQQVNHLKLINRTDVSWNNHLIRFDLGFQHNFRQEYSQYVNHGYMPPVYPQGRDVPANLEREFDKHVYSFNVKDEILIKNHKLSFGLNTEYQQNEISGWSFLVPAFRQFTSGLFVYDKYTLSEEVLLHGAVRYDFGNIAMDRYDDWFPTPVVSGNGQANSYLTRAQDLTRKFNSLVYSIGLNVNRDQMAFKLNLGKSFRMPIAKELGANGVNYHYFSYEKGNAGLSPEVSYQADLGINWKNERLEINFSPFYNYFPNYIYLNPTADHDYDYGAGNQVFQYAQSRVMRYGAELQLKINISRKLSAEALSEYLYARQLSGMKKGYTLPFSPPPSALFNLTYTTDLNPFFRSNFLSVDYRLTAPQHHIVPPEKKTAGYSIINVQAGSKLHLRNNTIGINFQVQNLFNTRYLNHTSFYRLIALPEAGRNFIIAVNIPFKIK